MSVKTDAICLVARTCAAQELPKKVTDPTVLAKVATLLRPERDRDQAAGPGLCKDSRRLGARGGRHGDDTP